MIQDLLTILSHPLVVGLSVLAVSLYLGYWFTLRREKKLEVMVRHSDELKDLVKRWNTELPLIPDPICPAISKISKLELPVENELLFAHLGEHMPSDLDIMETWNDYRRLLLEYNERRFHLTEEISSEICNRTGFEYRPVADHGMGKKGFTKHLLALAYNQLARLDDEKAIQEYSKKRLLIKDLGGRFDLRDFRGNTVLAWISSQETDGSSDQRTDRRLSLSKAKSQIIEFLNHSIQNYLDKYAGLTKEKKKMDEKRQELLLQLNDLVSFPLLPNECRYTRV